MGRLFEGVTFSYKEEVQKASLQQEFGLSEKEAGEKYREAVES